MVGYFASVVIHLVLGIAAPAALVWLLVTAIKNKSKGEQWDRVTARNRTIAWIAALITLVVIYN